MPLQREGATLFELLIGLAFLGVLLSLSFPHMQQGLDSLAVRAARENAFALISRARVIALQQGGAQLELDAQADRIAIRPNSGVPGFEQWYGDTGIDLVLDGRLQAVTLRYDAYGLGRMTSRTLRFRAGAAEAGLTISSYGRARRW